MNNLSSLSQLKLSMIVNAAGILFTIGAFFTQNIIFLIISLAFMGLGWGFTQISSYRINSTLKQINDICDQSVNGNLEPRIILLKDSGELKRLANNINNLLDITDAFIRESRASFDAIHAGDFHRRIIERGLKGTFKQTANSVNEVVGEMHSRFDGFANLISATESSTDRVLDHFLEMSTQMNQNSNEMLLVSEKAEAEAINIGIGTEQNTKEAQLVAEAAESLNNVSMQISAKLNSVQSINHSAIEKIENTRSALKVLQSNINEIVPIVDIIHKVSSKTRILALNASIEAEKSGVHGLAFKIVASEVKALADQTATASEDIATRIKAIDVSSNETNQTIQTFVGTVEDLTLITNEVSDSIATQLDSIDNIIHAIEKTADRSYEVSHQVNNVITAIKQTFSQARSVNEAAGLLGENAKVLDNELGGFLKSAKQVAAK